MCLKVVNHLSTDGESKNTGHHNGLWKLLHDKRDSVVAIYLNLLRGKANAECARPSIGVPGDDPRKILKYDFKRFGGEMFQNSEDYKAYRI